MENPKKTSTWRRGEEARGMKPRKKSQTGIPFLPLNVDGTAPWRPCLRIRPYPLERGPLRSSRRGRGIPCAILKIYFPPFRAQGRVGRASSSSPSSPLLSSPLLAVHQLLFISHSCLGKLIPSVLVVVSLCVCVLVSCLCVAFVCALLGCALSCVLLCLDLS